MRKKLIELVREGVEMYTIAEFIADHLISNGVTIQEWIPVTERLPETELVMDENKFAPGGYMKYYISRPVLVRAEEIVVGRYVKEDDNGEWWEPDSFINEPVTHWMPLPEPPKGE